MLQWIHFFFNHELKDTLILNRTYVHVCVSLQVYSKCVSDRYNNKLCNPFNYECYHIQKGFHLLSTLLSV